MSVSKDDPSYDPWLDDCHDCGCHKNSCCCSSDDDSSFSDDEPWPEPEPGPAQAGGFFQRDHMPEEFYRLPEEEQEKVLKLLQPPPKPPDLTPAIMRYYSPKDKRSVGEAVVTCGKAVYNLVQAIIC